MLYKVKFEVIRVKWDQSEIWIHIKVENIIVVEIQFTNEHRQKVKIKQAKKQTKKNEWKQAYAKVDLDLDDS